MTKKAVFLLIICCCFIGSCSITKEPEYQHMDHIEVEKFNTKEVVIKGNLVFYNPNVVGATVESNNLTVWYKGEKIANVEADDFKAKSKGVFQIPISIKVSTKKFLQENSIDIIKGLWQASTNKKKTFDINIKGDITLKVAGIKFKKILNETQEIEL